MKYTALLALIGAGLLALPSSAAAQVPDDGAARCPAGVDVDSTDGHICVHQSGQGGEAVLDPAGCSYINGWDSGAAPGYAGICTHATHNPACPEPRPGPNEGGCFWLKDAPGASALFNSLDTPARDVTDMFICGNTSGGNPESTTRDGCFVP